MSMCCYYTVHVLVLVSVAITSIGKYPVEYRVKLYVTWHNAMRSFFDVNKPQN